MVIVHGMWASGNCWKVATILRLTGQAFRWVEVDSNGGATRGAAFLALNPNGKVPILVLEDGAVVTESNAILCHVAEGTPWLPPPGLARTRVMEWLFFEQYSHEPYISVARNLIAFLKQGEAQRARIEECHLRGGRALDVMERRLTAHDWLAGDTPSAADIALVAYTQAADEGGFDLAGWPGVHAWVARVLALPGIEPLPRAPG